MFGPISVWNAVSNQLTGQAGDTLVGDGRFAQVEHLQFVQVFANQLQTGVAKLWVVTTKVNAINNVQSLG